MVHINVKETNGLSLAYLGDAIWELVVREYFIATGHKVNQLNKLAVNYVNAKGQSKIYRAIIEEIEDEYRDVAKRAKNGRIKSFPRSCTITEYREATAFEALVAALYIDGKMERVKKIFLEYVEGDK